MNPLYKKHIISIDDLNLEEIALILKTAEQLKVQPKPDLLKHKIIASCFFEASTRTRLSFEASIYRLGANIVGFSDANNTSFSKKGESLEDTITVISTYVDAIIIRHPKEGTARIATKFSRNVPIFNAGDGSNQHPTQTLLDLFTILETQGRLKDLNVVMIGDLKYSRTVHSLARALAKFQRNRFLFISPEILAMPKYITDMLDKKGIYWSVHKKLKEVIREADILYVTRMQKERFSPLENVNVQFNFVLHVDDLEGARDNMKILHPLPRTNEITTSVDNTQYAWYFHQASNGMFTRQALLSLVLRKDLIV